MVNPYPFKGGNPTDYEVFIGNAGTYNTRHIPTGDTIPCVQPSDYSLNLNPTMLQLFSLGVGLLNLGIGVFNTCQLNEINDKIDLNHSEIKGYFKDIEDTLNIQQRMLEVLLVQQHNLSEQMSILRQEMLLGFQSVLYEVQDIEVRRFRKEFYANSYELIRAYERFIDHFPELSEADRLIDKAERLEAWLQAELCEIDAGRPERLPLIVALTISIRAKADAFRLKGLKYKESAQKSLSILRQQIQNEVYALCNGRSIYELGVEIPEIIYQYLMLIRGITRGLELQDQEHPTSVATPDDYVWEDGLDEFREVFTPPQEDSNQRVITASTKIRLKTIAHYEWYVKFSEKERETFDVHSLTTIYLAELLQRIGYPEPRTAKIYQSQLSCLMQFALPEKIDELGQHIQESFGLDRYLDISKSVIKPSQGPGATDLAQFSSYGEYLEWFKKHHPDQSPFDKSEFYASMRYGY